MEYVDYQIELNVPHLDETFPKILEFVSSLAKTGNSFKYEYYRALVHPNRIVIKLGEFTETGYNNWLKYINDYGLKAYINTTKIIRCVGD